MPGGNFVLGLPAGPAGGVSRRGPAAGFRLSCSSYAILCASAVRQSYSQISTTGQTSQSPCPQMKLNIGASFSAMSRKSVRFSRSTMHRHCSDPHPSYLGRQMCTYLRKPSSASWRTPWLLCPSSSISHGDACSMRSTFKQS